MISRAGGGSTGGSKAVDLVHVKNISATNAATAPLVAISTVEVGDPGNQPTNVFLPQSGTNLIVGGVPATFRIGTFEVSVGQYATFLNAVAAVTNSTNASLYSPNLMGTPANVSGITRSGSGTPASPFIYTPSGNPSHPMAHTTWFNAVRFANWMHNGATNGASTEGGAYTLNGETNNGSAIARNPGAKWWIPSEDEWFKAAYYKGGASSGYFLFPTKSDLLPGNSSSAETNQANFRRSFEKIFCVTQTNAFDPTQNYLTPVGFFTNTPGPYGTFDQGGNVDEWTDTAVQTAFGNGRVTRGGSWNSGGLNNNADPRSVNLPKDVLSTLGFRLACAGVSTNVSPSLSGAVLVSVGPSPASLVPPNGIVSFRVRPGQYTVIAQAQSTDPALQPAQTNATFSTGGFSNRSTFVTVQVANDTVSITQIPPSTPPPF